MTETNAAHQPTVYTQPDKKVFPARRMRALCLECNQPLLDDDIANHRGIHDRCWIAVANNVLIDLEIDEIAERNDLTELLESKKQLQKAILEAKRRILKTTRERGYSSEDVHRLEQEALLNE